jgi:hypothetical protein
MAKRKMSRSRSSSKRGWHGEAMKHSKARYGSKWKSKMSKAKKQTSRGFKKDKAIKAKHKRHPWQPRWRGDVKGSRV